MRKNSYKNFRLASLAFYLRLKSVYGPDLRSKISVIYATSAGLFYIFHTIAFLIKKYGEKCR